MYKNYSPLISVIMPCHNPRLDYFEEAVESVLAQSYPHWELVIVNDGSSKESTGFLEQIVKKINDKRISVLHLSKNFGPSIARNKGIELAKGEIITFLDADDIHLPWHYEEIISNFKNNPECLILIAQCLLYTKLGKIRKVELGKTFFDLLEGKEEPAILVENIKNAKTGMSPTLALKKDVFQLVHFDPDLKFAEDLDLHLQILKNEKLANSISIFAKSGYLYRQYPSLKRITHIEEPLFKNRKKIIDRYKDDDSLAGNMIRGWQKNSYGWKLCVPLDNFMKEGSIFRYLKAVALTFPVLKDRIQSLRELVRMIFIYRFLIPVFGINERYLTILFSEKNNRYKTFKKLYLEHLQTYSDKKARHYAERIFKKAF